MAPTAYDPSSYSTHACRCGSTMSRLLPGNPHTWECPSPGLRQHAPMLSGQFVEAPQFPEGAGRPGA